MKYLKIFGLFIIVLVIAYGGFLGFSKPSHNRLWWPELSKNAEIIFDDNEVVVKNVRLASYDKNARVTDISFEDRGYNLDNLQTLDYFVTPFGGKGVAHTILSFGFGDSEQNEYLALSVEARKEIAEDYGLVRGMLNQYELHYIWADEFDVIRTRVEDRGEATYRYRLDNITQDNLQKLFIQLAKRTNELAANPEFYHTIWNNCTIDLWRQVNRALPDALPWTLTTIFPEKSGQYLIEQGLLSDAQASMSLRERQVPSLDADETSIQNYSSFIRN